MISEDLPLGDRTIIRTSDRDEAYDFATTSISDMSIAYRRPDSHFAFHLAGDQLGTMQVLAMDMHIGGGASFAVEGAEDWYVVELPLFGQTGVTYGTETHAVAPGRKAFIHSPDDRVNWEDEGSRYRALSLKIPATTLRRRLAHLNGDENNSRIAFHPFVDLSSPDGRNLISIMSSAVELLSPRNSAFENPANAALFEEFVANALLTVLPNSASRSLHLPVARTSEAGLKRVMDYLDVHLDKPINIADMADVAGVSVRSLQRSFRYHYGTSPIRHLRLKRLDRARDRLLASEGSATVSQVAFASGFTHLGAFSADYKDRFGETPSETLARFKS